MKVKILALLLVTLGIASAAEFASAPAVPTAAPAQVSVVLPAALPALLPVSGGPAQKPYVAPAKPVRTAPAPAAARSQARVIPVAQKPAQKPAPKPAPPRRQSSNAAWDASASVWAAYPAWVEDFALCVAHHESWRSGLWVAENPISSASGAFQWIDGSWQVNLRRAGLSGPRHASHASPILQAKVTAYSITHGGRRNWAGTHCGYGT